MIVRAVLISVCLLAGSADSFAQPADQRAPAAPQSPRPSPTPAATPTAQPVAPPRPQGQPLNIKVDVTITDQRGTAQAFKKTVTVVTADGLSGFIRSTATYRNIGAVPLNVDAEPFILSDGKVRVRVNLQYDLPAAPPADQAELAARTEERRAGELTKTQIHESLALILESGKPLVVAQSADPVGDRQVTIEVKATILR